MSSHTTWEELHSLLSMTGTEMHALFPTMDPDGLLPSDNISCALLHTSQQTMMDRPGATTNLPAAGVGCRLAASQAQLFTPQQIQDLFHLLSDPDQNISIIWLLCSAPKFHLFRGA